MNEFSTSSDHFTELDSLVNYPVKGKSHPESAGRNNDTPADGNSLLRGGPEDYPLDKLPLVPGRPDRHHDLQ